MTPKTECRSSDAKAGRRFGCKYNFRILPDTALPQFPSSMTASAALIEHVFLFSVVLFLLCECFLTARQILAAERAVETVPEGFGGRLSLAAHKKAAAYTTETALANLVLAFTGAGFAVLMTAGHGLTVAAAFLETLSDNTLLVEWTLLAITAFLMLLVELPFGWYARFRVKERFGYMKHSRGEWLARTLTKSAAGWGTMLPLSAILLVLFELAGVWWWLILWTVWLAGILWRWRLSLVRGVLWSHASRPIESSDLRALVADFLAAHGYQMEDLVVMTKPGVWKHAHVLLVGTGTRRRVVVFAHAAAKLTREELLAVIAANLARLKAHHTPWRIFLEAAGGLIVCAALGWGSTHWAFFAGLGFSPSLTIDQPGSHTGFTAALALVTFPILFYPLRPIFNFISRQMQYSADRFALRAVGGAELTRALVKLHRDYASTLTPSRIYSLFHYDRPHAGMRVSRILSAIQRENLPESGPSDLIHFRWSPYIDREHPTRTVLGGEMAIRKKMRDEAKRFSRARKAAELEQALQKERDYVVDDGLDEGEENGAERNPLPNDQPAENITHEESYAQKN